MQFNLYICWRLDLLMRLSLMLTGELREEVKMIRYDFRWMVARLQSDDTEKHDNARWCGS